MLPVAILPLICCGGLETTKKINHQSACSGSLSEEISGDKQNSSAQEASQQVMMSGSTSENGETTASYNPNSAETQMVQASLLASSGSDALSASVAISFPPGALAVGASITVQTAEPLDTSSEMSGLLSGGSATAASAAVMVTASGSGDMTIHQPLTIAISLEAASSSASLALAGQNKQEVPSVLYQAQEADGSWIRGVIDSSQVQLEAGEASFQAVYWGAYQLVYLQGESVIAKTLPASSAPKPMTAAASAPSTASAPASISAPATAGRPALNAPANSPPAGETSSSVTSASTVSALSASNQSPQISALSSNSEAVAGLNSAQSTSLLPGNNQPAENSPVLAGSAASTLGENNSLDAGGSSGLNSSTPSSSQLQSAQANSANTTGQAR